jgi:hypothetical protein
MRGKCYPISRYALNSPRVMCDAIGASELPLSDSLAGTSPVSMLQERAWYDTNRSSILLGHWRMPEKDDATAQQSPYQDLNLQQHQSRDAFAALDDGDQGFYCVYGRLFERAHEQEQQAWQAQHGNTAASSQADAASVQEPLARAPRFGDSQSQEQEVRAFYTHWAAFQTVKSFAWMEPHDARSGTGRHMRRLLEAENAKVRKAGRVAYNRQVRGLAEWVQALDPRLHAFAVRRCNSPSCVHQVGALQSTPRSPSPEASISEECAASARYAQRMVR